MPSSSLTVAYCELASGHELLKRECGFLNSEVGQNKVFCTLLLFLFNNQVQTFIFHSNVQKVVEELKYSSKSSHFHCPIGYSFGMVSIGTFSIFEKLDFPFYSSFCHMKTVPPMKTFDFFTLNQLRKSRPFKI